MDKTKPGLHLVAGLGITSIECLAYVIQCFLLVWLCKITLRKHMQQLCTYIACSIIKLGKLNY